MSDVGPGPSPTTSAVTKATAAFAAAMAANSVNMLRQAAPRRPSHWLSNVFTAMR